MQYTNSKRYTLNLEIYHSDFLILCCILLKWLIVLKYSAPLELLNSLPPNPHSKTIANQEESSECLDYTVKVNP